MSAMTGTPVYLDSALADGTVITTTFMASGNRPGIHIGTRPMTDVEFAGAEGRYIVRRGMADVLKWLGEDVGPAPVRSGRGVALWIALRNQATPTPEESQ